MSTLVKSHDIICSLYGTTNIRTKMFLKSLYIVVIIHCVWSCSYNKPLQEEGHIKVALRDVGHRLLLSNQDTSSRVLPVRELEEFTYQVSFEGPLAIHPDTLVALVKGSFQKANIPQNYLTEVIQCTDGEVVYSYEMNKNKEKGIIPCSGRYLPRACYILSIRFFETQKPQQQTSIYVYLLITGGILTVFLLFFKRKKIIPSPHEENYVIGSFTFYPEQNKLVKSAREISLSKKECELLAIFIAHPNQVVKRDELTKRVWEDHGVIVGRSLDTYISKLRKKLKEDDSIKITNVHGVGYKLEVY